MAWDTRPVHRLERFPGYKASRKPTPSLLKQQQPYLRPLVEAFGYRNVAARGLRGRRRDRHAEPARGRAGDRNLRDLARSRRLPARVRQRLRAALAARRDGRARLHARARRGPLRHPAEAHARLHRAQGRHLRRHPGRPRHRRQDGLGAARALRLARGHLRERGRRARREAAPDADRAPRGGGALQAAGDDRARPRARRRPRAGAGRSARPGDHGGAVPPLRVPRAAAPHRRARGSRPGCGGRARGARRSAPSAATPRRSRSLLADGGPVGLAGDGDGTARHRARRAGAADRRERCHAGARGRCQPARRAQLQGRSAGRWPRPVSCPPSTPSWPRT